MHVCVQSQCLYERLRQSKCCCVYVVDVGWKFLLEMAFDTKSCADSPRIQYSRYSLYCSFTLASLCSMLIKRYLMYILKKSGRCKAAGGEKSRFSVPTVGQAPKINSDPARYLIQHDSIFVSPISFPSADCLLWWGEIMKAKREIMKVMSHVN